MIILLLAFGASEALAQGATRRCGPRDDILAHVLGAWGETVKAWIGINNLGNMVERYEHPISRAWSIVTTDPEGVSCVVGTGIDSTILLRQRGIRHGT